MSLTNAVKAYLAKVGAKGGAATKGISTEAKAAAARKNGAKGGRPKHKKPSKVALAKRKSRMRMDKSRINE